MCRNTDLILTGKFIGLLLIPSFFQQMHFLEFLSFIVYFPSIFCVNMRTSFCIYQNCCSGFVGPGSKSLTTGLENLIRQGTAPIVWCYRLHHRLQLSVSDIGHLHHGKPLEIKCDVINGFPFKLYLCFLILRCHFEVWT